MCLIKTMVGMVIMMHLFGGLHTVVGSADDGTGQAEFLHAQLTLCVPEKPTKL